MATQGMDTRDGGLSALPPSGSEEFSVYLKGLTGAGSDLSLLATWLSGQRPSNVLGLIQFAKEENGPFQ